MTIKSFNVLFATLFFLASNFSGAEETIPTSINESSQETIFGILRKSSKPQACAQIVDSLNENYLVFRSQDAAKACKPFLGKSVELIGTVEEDPETGQYYIRLKEVRLFKKEEVKIEDDGKGKTKESLKSEKGVKDEKKNSPEKEPVKVDIQRGQNKKPRIAPSEKKKTHSNQK